MFNAKYAVLATAVLAFSFQLMATDPTDVYQQSYFYNIGNGHYGNSPMGGPNADASFTILDPGVNAPASICANIYVLNPSEELEACCSVRLTPDEIVQGQVSNLVTNLLNNNGLVNGVIKIISSSVVAGPVPCPSGSATLSTTADLRAWITRLDSTTPFARGPNQVLGVTTTSFAQAPLSPSEQSTLVNTCHFIYLYGSNFGQCPVPVEPYSGGSPAPTGD
jgi:hypothetical protein